jgi:hypothetical protein
MRLQGEIDACNERGWRWVMANLPRFAPHDPTDPQELQRTVELALLWSVAENRWADVSLKTELGQIKSFLVDLVNWSVISECARKSPSLYNPYIYTYLLLRSAGYRSIQYERALKDLRRAGYPDAIESTPFRVIERRYFLWKAGLSSTPPGWHHAYRSTTLSRYRTPIYLSNSEVYSITHTLFYIGDFSGPIRNLPLREHGKIATTLDVLAIFYAREHNWDILGELLINMVAFDKKDEDLFKVCVLRLLEAWRADGALPSPNFKPDTISEDIGKVFTDCYHTTLVGLLLCGCYNHRNMKAEP